MYFDISPSLVLSISICDVRNKLIVNLVYNSLNQKVKVRLSLATKKMADTEAPPLTPPTIQTDLTNQMWRWLLVLRCLILPLLPLNYLPTCRPCRGAGAQTTSRILTEQRRALMVWCSELRIENKVCLTTIFVKVLRQDIKSKSSQRFINSQCP